MSVRLRLGIVVWGVLFVAFSRGGEPALERMKKDVFFLASPECEGRGPGTKGLDLAAEHISKRFAEANLKPGGNKGYFQPFTISGSPVLEKPNVLSFRGPQGQTIEFALGADFDVMGLSGKGKVSAPLVFAGYGIQGKKLGYDDFEGLDVAGKIVVILRHTPRWGHAELPFAEKERDLWASLERKVATAESLKAAAIVLVNDAFELATGDMIPPFAYLTQATSSRIPCVHVKRSVIDPVFRSVYGASLLEMEHAIDRDLKPRSGVLPGWTATVQTSVTRSLLPVKNVVGVVEGSGPLAKEYVVVGAHYDHLGYGGMGSLAKNPREKAIHHGADDNASGTTALLELARRFASQKDRQGRTLVFMTFSAEERGLLGSQHYCNKEPLFPLEKTAAMVNLDMVGRLRPDATSKKDKLIVQGIGTAKEFDPLVQKLNKPDFTFVKIQAGLGPSDHASFYQKKVPVLFFWTGTHEDYHKPTDTADRINFEGMGKVVGYVESVIDHLAADPSRPQYVEVKGASPSRTMKGPRLGISPNYESEKDGVLIGSVTEGGPAAKGGLKSGDRIVELAGKNVSNLETYMVIMGEQRLGATIDVGVIRDGKKLKLKVVLQ